MPDLPSIPEALLGFERVARLELNQHLIGARSGLPHLLSYLETNVLYPLSYVPTMLYGHLIEYVTMNIGHFQPLVSRRVKAMVEMHCGAKN